MSEQQNNEKKVYYIPCEMTREDAAFMGIDPKLVRPLYIDGRLSAGIQVATENEELYRAFARKQSAIAQEIRLHRRCLESDAHNYGFRFCRRNCEECCRESHAAEISLEALQEEDGFDLMDQTHMETSVQESNFLYNLSLCIKGMNRDEKLIARAILNRVPDKAVMKLLGIEKQSTYSSRKMKVRKKLQEAMEAWL